MESILMSIKKLLGIEAEYTIFDTDIITNINMSLMILEQIGVGPVNGFVVSDSSQTWLDFMQAGVNIGAVKTYIYLRVKQVFDPPTSSFVLESLNKQIQELEWRLNVKAEGASSNG